MEAEGIAPRTGLPQAAAPPTQVENLRHRGTANGRRVNPPQRPRQRESVLGWAPHRTAKAGGHGNARPTGAEGLRGRRRLLGERIPPLRSG